MAAAVVLLLALLALQRAPTSIRQIEVTMAERMQQREEYLRQKMDQLLQEIDQRESAEETMRLSLWQQWPFWTFAAALVLLTVACWLARQVKLTSKHCEEKDSSSHEKEDKEEDEDGLSSVHHGVRSAAASTPSPMTGISSP